MRHHRHVLRSNIYPGFRKHLDIRHSLPVRRLLAFQSHRSTANPQVNVLCMPSHLLQISCDTHLGLHPFQGLKREDVAPAIPRPPNRANGTVSHGHIMLCVVQHSPQERSQRYSRPFLRQHLPLRPDADDILRPPIRKTPCLPREIRSSRPHWTQTCFDFRL